MLKSEARKNTSIGTIEGQVSFDNEGVAKTSDAMEKLLSYAVEDIELISNKKPIAETKEEDKPKKPRAKKATKTSEK